MREDKRSELDKYLRKRDHAEQQGIGRELVPAEKPSLLPSDLKTPTEIGAEQEGVGLLDKIRLSREAQKARVEGARVIIRTQLQYLREQVSVTKDLKTKDLQLAYETASQKMKDAYADMLRDLGLEHKRRLVDAITQLTLQTDQQMTEALKLAIHDRYKTQLIDAIDRLHEDMFNRMMGELGDKVEEMGEERKQKHL